MSHHTLVAWVVVLVASLLAHGTESAAPASPTSSLLLPAVDYTYRSPEDYSTCNTSHNSPENNYEVEIDVSLLQKALPLNLTLNTRGVGSLLNRLRRHEDIHVLVLGGSFTKGAGVFRGASRAALNWAGRFNTWLKAAFPHSRIIFHNRAQGSTTSFYAIHKLRQFSRPVDLIIMEYALNDRVQTSPEVHKLAHITEAIIRHVHQTHHQTPLVYLALNVYTPLQTNAERIHQEVCDVYGVPLVSYRRAVVDEFNACIQRSASVPYLHTEKYCVPNFRPRTPHTSPFVFKLWDGEVRLVHPVEETHRLVAQTMAYYITQLVALYNSSSSISSMPEPDVIFPPRPLYALHDPQTDSELTEEGCVNPLSHFSSLNTDSTDAEDEDEHANATALREAFEPRRVEQGSCWSFRRDHRGKPFGWVAASNFMSSEGNSGSGSFSAVTGTGTAENQLTFEVLMVSGTISITYLSSYENSGQFEVYIGVKDFVSNGGVGGKKSSAAGTLLCKCRVGLLGFSAVIGCPVAKSL